VSTRLHAATGGHDPRDTDTVVFIHGAGANRTTWAVQARHLAARGLDVLALDLPGHGKSPGAPQDRVEAYRDAVIDELTARGLTKVGLVGHSMGTMIAMAVTAEQPDLVTRLALLGTGLKLRVNEALLTSTRDDPATAIDAIVDWGHSPAAHIGGGQTPGLWMDGLDTAILRSEVAAHPGTLHADFTALSVFDATKSASAISCPTLVIVGERDLMAPARVGHELAATIADAELLELEGCGHFMTVERPVEVSRALARFFLDQ
jgi:pimeloyl-ACP methyl ester carboxylesterase